MTPCPEVLLQQVVEGEQRSAKEERTAAIFRRKHLALNGADFATRCCRTHPLDLLGALPAS